MYKKYVIWIEMKAAVSLVHYMIIRLFSCTSVKKTFISLEESNNSLDLLQKCI